MTAEIAILNRSAVALAADSAVTVERQTGPGESEKRVLKGANKVFALSRIQPVGVMIFGDASFMGVPWETLIKMYRTDNAKVCFDTLAEYPHDLFKYLEAHDSLFPEDSQRAAARGAMIKYALMVLHQAFSKAGDKGLSGKRNMNRIIGEEIDLESKFIEKKSFAKGFDSRCTRPLLDKYQDEIDRAIEAVFGAYTIAKPRLAKLRRILVGAITRLWFKDADAGIVFAGFGRKEHYPRLIDYRCRGVYENVLLRTKLEVHEISDSQASVIVPFAQTEMVKTFMLGIDPQILEAVQSFLTSAFGRLQRTVRRHAPAASSGVGDAAKAIRKQFDDDFVDYIRANHAQPMYRILDVLSKDELAELAETLITMESLKKRITQPIESVGGPVDVAVISKAEGLIWIKRKHYFSRELNEDFFLRRQLM